MALGGSREDQPKKEQVRPKKKHRLAEKISHVKRYFFKTQKKGGVRGGAAPPLFFLEKTWRGAPLFFWGKRAPGAEGAFKP